MRQIAENKRDNIQNLGNSCDNVVEATQKRKIRPTRRSVSGVYAFRGETGIAFESTLERDFLIRSEFFSNVAQIVAQPVQIPFIDSRGIQNTYTPDFLVYRSLGNRSYREYPKPELIEVKPQSEWQTHWRKWSTKWKAARTLAKENGWVLKTVEEMGSVPFHYLLARHYITQVSEFKSVNLVAIIHAPVPL